MPVIPDESIQLFFDGLRPCQESLMLTEFVVLNPGERVLDVGCGTGYLSLFLGWKYRRSGEITGIDIVSSLVERAIENRNELQDLLPDALPLIHFRNQDANTNTVPKENFDVLVSNPPFFDSRASRPALIPHRRIARQDGSLTIQELMECARRQLKEHGRMAIVLPAQRLDEVRIGAETNGMEIVRTEHDPSVRKRSGGISLIELVKREPA